MLLTKPKTHLIIMKDWTKFNITEAQYELYREEIWMKKHNEFITINDIDTNEILFEWRCSEIKEFKTKWQSKYYDSVWICTKWWRHPVLWFPNNCNCN